MVNAGTTHYLCLQCPKSMGAIAKYGNNPGALNEGILCHVTFVHNHDEVSDKICMYTYM